MLVEVHLLILSLFVSAVPSPVYGLALLVFAPLVRSLLPIFPLALAWERAPLRSCCPG